MLLYRSIGDDELRSLISTGSIQGRYNCSNELQNSFDGNNACCFFVDEVRWRDAQHHFFIILDIPEDRLSFGIGDYWASKNFRKTKEWTGRSGDSLYKIREAYASFYSLKDVKAIYIFDRFASHYQETLANQLKEYNLDILFDTKTNFSSIFKNSTQSFKKVSYYYQTIDDLNKWVNSFAIDKKAFISKIKKQIANTNLTFEQARKINEILSA